MGYLTNPTLTGSSQQHRIHDCEYEEHGVAPVEHEDARISSLLHHRLDDSLATSFRHALEQRVHESWKVLRNLFAGLAVLQDAGTLVYEDDYEREEENQPILASTSFFPTMMFPSS